MNNPLTVVLLLVRWYDGIKLVVQLNALGKIDDGCSNGGLFLGLGLLLLGLRLLLLGDADGLLLVMRSFLVLWLLLLGLRLLLLGGGGGLLLLGPRLLLWGLRLLLLGLRLLLGL